MKPKETFHLNPCFLIEGCLMIGLPSLNVDKIIFYVIEENNKFKPYKFLDSKSGGVSYEKVTGEIEKD